MATLLWALFSVNLVCWACDVTFRGLRMTPEQQIGFNRDLTCMTNRGHWVLDVNHTRPRFQDRRVCEGCGRYCTEDPPNPAQDFIWQTVPGQCNSTIVPFDADKLCAMLAGQSVMLVGDSVQTELGIVLTNMLYENNPTAKCSVCGFMCSVTNTIECKNGQSFKLSVYRSDRLDLQLKDYNSWGANFHHRKWLHVLAEQNVSLLIMNRGAHFENVFTIINHLDKLFEYIFSHHPGISVIWRDSPNPVVDYQKQYNSMPLSQPRTFDDVLHPGDLPYNWYFYKSQNIALREFFYENWNGAVTYLDVATPMSYRVDSQVDYLHYRIPGLIDTWATLLYNVLVRAKFYQTGCVL